jgi:hypothetical protein
VNAQLAITTTPKYNFPLPHENLEPPRQLIELSVRSLQALSPFGLACAEDRVGHRLLLGRNQQVFSKVKALSLTPDSTETAIAAIDVSSIRLGETEAGVLLAVRGAVVWRRNNKYKYLRLGPFPFHITEESTGDIRRSLYQQHQNADGVLTAQPGTFYVQTKLTTILERWIQKSVNETTQDSIILWDGNIAANTLETPMQTLEQLLSGARDNRNAILAFSKMTRLLVNGRRITDFAATHRHPCLIKIQGHPVCFGPVHAIGSVYVAKLSAGSCAFRLDVDDKLPQAAIVGAVERLLGNEGVFNSYPEALRLAHIFSTFTATEVIGVQRYIAREKNIKIISRPNVRRILFGSYGKGPEG